MINKHQIASGLFMVLLAFTYPCLADAWHSVDNGASQGAAESNQIELAVTAECRDGCGSLVVAADATGKQGERREKGLESDPKAGNSQAKKRAKAKPIKQGSVDTESATFLCTKGKRVRKIIVEAPSKGTKHACRVLYHSDGRISTPWSARYDKGYCRLKAVTFVARQIGWGWSCLRQE